MPSTVPTSVSGASVAVAVSRIERATRGVLLAKAGEPEVEQLRPRARQHHVRGLQVPVDDAPAVGRVERRADLAGDPDRLIRGERPPGETLRERLPLDQLHDEIRGSAFGSDVVQRADVRVGERGDDLRLALEPLPHLVVARETRRKHLDRDVPPEPRVPRAPDLAHPARAEEGEDLVGSQAVACFETQLRSNPCVRV